MGEFGLQGKGKSKSEILIELSCFLIARHRQGFSTVLVVDEAQVVGRETLEEIRLLTNLETSQHKLLQIVLVGQSELEETLFSPSLRQLRQRIALWCRLAPLNEQETGHYIARRLELAGLSKSRGPLFSPEAVAIIHQLSRGIPRLVNIVCDNSLIAAYGQQAPAVAPEVVAQVAAEFRLHGGEEPTKTNGQGDYKGVLRKLREIVDSFQEIEPSHISDSVSSQGAGHNEQRV
jgi:type II secretory pathway predicted ATPase ExeA